VSQHRSEVIAKQVAEERKRVEEAFDAIQRRLTPGQLVDEILTYAEHAGSGFAANLGKSVTANPIPAVMIGVGLVWLILAQKQASPDTAANEDKGKPDSLSGL
jgi:hypothetical protein